MNFQQRLADICRRMREERLDFLVAFHDGSHFIETPNPVMVVTGFKSLGAAAALLRPDGATQLFVTPKWDAERAAECCPSARVMGADNVVAGVLEQIGGARSSSAVGLAGLRFLPAQIADAITAALPQAR